MGDDLDVDALLEAPFDNREKSKEHDDKQHNGEANNERRTRSRSPAPAHKSSREDRSKSRERKRDKKKKSRSRSKSRDRDKDRGREKDRDRDRRRRSRSRDRGHRRSRSRDRDRRPRRRSRSRERHHGRFRGRRSSRSRSRSRSAEMPLTPEERDARTIFVMQLSQRVRARDVEEFFSAVGKIRDVKLIICNKTRRFKGIAYVEFKDLDSVPLALGLSGQKLLGVPVIVQPSQAEKNRMGSVSEPVRNNRDKGPMRLYVGSLHFNITEDMLRGIFEPFGKVTSIQLIMDPETGRSKGYGFISFAEADDAKKALEQLNGFELAGRPMKVGHVTERSDAPVGPSGLDSDELDRAGIDLGATGRLALMAKLAEGTGMKLPSVANEALNAAQSVSGGQQSSGQAYIQQQQQQVAQANPPIATQCFMLSNMFDPAQEANTPGWDLEVRDDVIEECNKYGGVLHILVDKVSPTGNVYVKCPSVATAVAAVNALHGRWFAGKVITAAYVPVINYHNLFPDAMAAGVLLQTRR